MGCRSEHMEPQAREKESVVVCKLLTYLLPQAKIPIAPQGMAIPDEVKAAANNIYGDQGKLDEHTALLCSVLGSLSPTQMKKLVYDGSNPMARKLADWWENHQKVDADRKENELKQMEQVLLVASAFSKLSDKEILAIRDIVKQSVLNQVDLARGIAIAKKKSKKKPATRSK